MFGSLGFLRNSISNAGSTEIVTSSSSAAKKAASKLLVKALTSLAFLPLLAWGDAHIFVYHRFDDPKRASASTSLEVLRAEFEYFKNNGYKVISLKRLHEALKNRETVDDKWVVLTIDDGYKSFYANALPLFKEYGYPFALFVYVEATGKGYRDYMTWQEIKEAQKYGEIGLHSYAHPHLVSLSAEEIEKDTLKGAEIFQKQLGYRPRFYAYPYGEYDAKVRSAVASFGFDLILNQNSGAVDNQSDRLDLDRTALTGENTLRQKLRIKTLPVAWIAPQSWPEDGKLKTIHATIPANVTDLEYYVSGYGWHRVKAKEGEVNVTVNLPLKMGRTRLFLKQGHRQNSIILVKE
jgi:peptidoglycan/xylan/chitin deacetylase (PgdA/CDA1 family)